MMLRLFVLTQSTNVTDTHTDTHTHTHRMRAYRPRLCIVSRGKNVSWVYTDVGVLFTFVGNANSLRGHSKKIR